MDRQRRIFEWIGHSYYVFRWSHHRHLDIDIWNNDGRDDRKSLEIRFTVYG